MAEGATAVLNQNSESRSLRYPTESALRDLFHDLGNQLAAFSCLLDSVGQDRGMSPESRGKVTTMSRQAGRLLAALRDAVAGPRGPEEVDLSELVTELAAVANALGAARVTVLPGAATRLRTHPEALWRVLANVLDNAVRAAGASGQVRVRVRPERHGALVEVTDDGPGFGEIPPGSASLGLAIAASLARRCQGRITIAAAEPRGVRVGVRFPDLAEEPPEHPGHRGDAG